MELSSDIFVERKSYQIFSVDNLIANPMGALKMQDTKIQDMKMQGIKLQDMKL